MAKQIEVDDEAYSVLEERRLQLENKLKRKLDFGEVIKELCKGGQQDPNYEMLSLIWEKLQSAADTLEEIKASIHEGRQTTPSIQEQTVTAEEEQEETQPSEEVVQAPQMGKKPRLFIPTSPSQGGESRQQARPSDVSEDKFIKFIKDVGAYQLSRLRKPLAQLKQLEQEGIIRLLGPEDDQIVVYGPSYDAMMSRLPMTQAQVDALSPAEKKILEELHRINLVYVDQHRIWRSTARRTDPQKT